MIKRLSSIEYQPHQDILLSLQQMQYHLKNNHIFHQLLSTDAIEKMLDLRNNRYLGYLRIKELSLILKKYFQLSLINIDQKVQLLQSTKKQIKFQNFKVYWNIENKIIAEIKNISKTFMQLDNKVYFENYNSLMIINHIIQTSVSELFKKANIFNLQPITAIFKFFRQEVCQRDINSFSLLYLYLEQCCRNAQNQGRNLKDIKNKLNQVLSYLQEQYPPAPQLQVSQQILLHHRSYKEPVQNYEDKIPFINLVNIPSENKQKAVLALIEQQISQAYKYYYAFQQLITGPCLHGTNRQQDEVDENDQNLKQAQIQKRNGFGLKIGIKIRSMKDKKAVDRTIQKMFKKDLRNIKNSGITQDGQNIHNQNMNEFYSNQITQYKSILNKLIQQAPIVRFNITDMLRAKCLFDHVDDINNCATLLIQKIQKLNKKKQQRDIEYQLIQIENRLKSETGTSDIVFKIRINSVITELQLVIKFNHLQNQFCHKIYQIRRSMFFEPINFIQIYNQIYSKPYMSRLQQIILQNNKLKSQEEQQKQYSNQQNQKIRTFWELISQWKIFCRQFLPNLYQFMPDYKQQFLIIPGAKHILRQAESKQRQKKPLYWVQKDSITWSKINGQFYFQQHQPNLCIKYFKLYIKQLQKHYEANDQLSQRQEKKQLENIYSKIGKKFKQINCIQESLQNYSKCLKIQLGDIQPTLAINFNVEQPNLTFQSKIQNKVLAYSTSSTLNNIGSLLQVVCKHDTALLYFQKCLQIKQNIDGISQIEIVNVLNNIGGLFAQKKQFNKSLEYYLKCESIQNKYAKKNPSLKINITSTLNNLGNIYYNNKSYKNALIYYENSLQFSNKHNGQISKQSAQILNNLGLVYDSLSNFQMSLSCYSKCLQIERKISENNSTIAITLSNIASLYTNTHQLQKALNYYQQSLKILNKVNHPTMKILYQISSIQSNIGYLYDLQQNIEKSIEFYRQALKTISQTESNQKSIHLAEVLNNLGMILHKGKRNAEAVKILKKALKIYQQFYNEQRKQILPIIINIGMVYDKAGDIQTSLHYYEKGEEIAKNFFHQDPLLLGRFLSIIANTYKNIGRNQYALQKFQELYNIQIKELGHNNSTVLKTKRSIDKLAQQLEQSKISTQRNSIISSVGNLFGQNNAQSIKIKNQGLQIQHKNKQTRKRKKSTMHPQNQILVSTESKLMQKNQLNQQWEQKNSQQSQNKIVSRNFRGLSSLRAPIDKRDDNSTYKQASQKHLKNNLINIQQNKKYRINPSFFKSLSIKKDKFMNQAEHIDGPLTALKKKLETKNKKDNQYQKQIGKKENKIRLDWKASSSQKFIHKDKQDKIGKNSAQLKKFKINKFQQSHPKLPKIECYIKQDPQLKRIFIKLKAHKKTKF